MKTTLKKALALALAVMLLAALAIPAWADENGETGGSGSSSQYTITVTKVMREETYTAYKIFDAAYSGTTATSYTITNTSASDEWFDDLVTGVTADGAGNYTLDTYGLKFEKTSTANVYNVVPSGTAVTQDQAKALADFLYTKISGKASAGTAAAPSTASGQDTDTVTININSNEPGYYFVTTTVGSLCALDTTNPMASITEKNTYPTVEAKVAIAAEEEFTDTQTMNIGDTVYYKITVKDGTGTDNAITLKNVINAGQTLVLSSFNVTDDDDNTSSISYSIKYNHRLTVEGNAATNVKADSDTEETAFTDDDNTSFQIDFPAEYVKSLGNDKTITITFQTKLNRNAAIASSGNPLNVTLDYSKQNSTSATNVYTYAAAIYKVDGSNTTGATELAGAVFSVTKDSDEVKLTQVNAGSGTSAAVYLYDTGANSNSITTPASGAVVIIGLADNTSLTLTETSAPTGYNLLSAPVTLNVKKADANTANKTATTSVGSAAATFVASTTEGETTTIGDDAGYQIAADSIQIIENNTGTELPSTGGMGTTVFYAVGGTLMVAAVVFFIAKRRAGSAE